jgi:hypothetical protein
MQVRSRHRLLPSPFKFSEWQYANLTSLSECLAILVRILEHVGPNSGLETDSPPVANDILAWVRPRPFPFRSLPIGIRYYPTIIHRLTDFCKWAISENDQPLYSEKVVQYRPAIRTKFISISLLGTCFGFVESHYQGIKKYINNNNTYLFTYSREQSPSWEGNRFSASQEIPHTL